MRGLVGALFFYIEAEAWGAGRAEELEDGFPNKLFALGFVGAENVLAIFANRGALFVEFVVGFDFGLCALPGVFAQVEQFGYCFVNIGF